MKQSDVSSELLDFRPLILRRHPINLLSAALRALLMILPLVVIHLAVSISDFGTLPTTRMALWLFDGVMAVFIISYFMMQWIFWYLDVWLLTNDRLIDVQLVTLFNRRVAQLNLSQVEDVRVETLGFLAALLHFGDITVQSAGREGVFALRSIPNASEVVTLISDLATAAQKALTQESATKVMKPLKLFGQILIDRGLISHADLESSLDEQLKTGKRLGEILLERKLITRDDLVHALSAQYNIPVVDLSSYQVDTAVLESLSLDKASRYLAIPISRSPDNVISVAVAQPTPDRIGELLAAFESPITFLIADEDSIRQAISRYYIPGNDSAGAANSEFWLK